MRTRHALLLLLLLARSTLAFQVSNYILVLAGSDVKSGFQFLVSDVLLAAEPDFPRGGDGAGGGGGAPPLQDGLPLRVLQVLLSLGKLLRF